MRQVRFRKIDADMGKISVKSRALAITLACISTLLGFVLLIAGRPSTLQGVIKQNTGHAVGNETSGDFLLGAGRGDITGPVVEINMMGYADSSQTGTGLRQRIYCRAFIAGSLTEPDERIAYLVLDTQSGDTAVRNGILEGIGALGSEYDVYTRHNGAAIAVTGTHSHSGPGAWLNYLLPQVTSKGFEKESYQAIVDGCVLAVKRAHTTLKPGRLSLGKTEVADGNINRSLFAYLANPSEERARYSTDVDKEMTVLSFEDVTGAKFASLSWFPVHGTSLYQNNTLITGDNKGVAAYLLEKKMEPTASGFVAGFSQANVGDTTPNILGAYCEDTGLECKQEDSTCGGKTQGCHGRGPFFQFQDQGTKSCYEIGKRQYEAALNLLHGSQMRRLEQSTVSSFHIFQDFSNYTFISPSDPSKELKTCSAALGYGFAGGTSDGPGAFDFTQGANDTGDSPSTKNPLWKVARAFIHQPSPEQVECQKPKPILLDVGAAEKPYAWSPNIVNIQALRIGPLIMIIAPGEATTMSGRRWREAIAQASSEAIGLDEPTVVLGGPANTYAHYIATEEEYAIQRYEGASTLFGPHTLQAYINLTTTYLPYLGTKDEVSKLEALPLGPQPPINVDRSLNFNRGVVLDSAGIGRQFGQELNAKPNAVYQPGSIVSNTFIGANPRNNFRLEGTFAAIEKFSTEHDGWTEVRSDRDWSLVYRWKRTNTFLGTSEVTIEWEIEDDAEEGTYRIKYYGDSKSLGGTISPFDGTGSSFEIKRSAKS